MNAHREPPPEAVAALQAGHRLEAIKEYRQATGASLKEANDWAQSYQNVPRSHRRGPVQPFVIPQQARDAWSRGNLIGAARITRDAFKVYIAEASGPIAHPAAKSIGDRPPPSRSMQRAQPFPLRHRTGLGPGEVPPVANFEGLAAALLMLAGAVVLALLL